MNDYKQVISDPKEFGKVAVLYGGLSAEREVSLKSGAAVLAGLKAKQVDAHGVDVGEDIVEQLKRGGYDRVFLILHGRGGEDGVIQGVLESMGLPYTGSGVQGSALGMDKLRTKQCWLGAGLPTPDFVVIDSEDDLQRVHERVGYPVIIKPVHEGSSIGMSKVDRQQDLKSAWEAAAEYDQEIIAEKWITGAEYTASILGSQALPLIRLETPNVFYDYEAKYLADTTSYFCPCGLPAELERSLQALALKAFRVAGASGWGRVDFMLDEEKNPWLIEINTAPGMTDHSLVPMAAKQAGIEFDELVWRILETSIKQT